MKNEIIHNHNKNIETPGSFHSIKLKTGLYANELSLIIPINPFFQDLQVMVLLQQEIVIFCPSLKVETFAVSPGINFAF